MLVLFFHYAPTAPHAPLNKGRAGSTEWIVLEFALHRPLPCFVSVSSPKQEAGGMVRLCFLIMRGLNFCKNKRTAEDPLIKEQNENWDWV